MNYEKLYIEYIIKESVKTNDLKPVLEKYLLNKIDFESFTIMIQGLKTNTDTFKQFKKSLDIDNLLG